MDDNGDPYQNSLFQNEQRLKLNKHKPNKPILAPARPTQPARHARPIRLPRRSPDHPSQTSQPAQASTPVSAEPIKPRFVTPTPAHLLPLSPARAMPSPIPFQPNRSPTRPVIDSIPPPGNPRGKANCNFPWQFLKSLHHLFL